jgi:membrane-associated protease RseP (regulator of RpoE activity)
MSLSLLAAGLLALLVLAHEGGRLGAERLLGLRARLLRLVPPPGPTWKHVAAILAAPLAAYLFLSLVVLTFFLVAGIQTGTSFYRVADTNPAFDAHGQLQPGDEIRQVNGETVLFAHQGERGRPLGEVIEEQRQRHGSPLLLTIVRDGETMLVPVHPRLDESMDPPVHRLGITLDISAETRPLGLADLDLVLASPAIHAAQVLQALFHHMVVPPDAAELTGPIGIAELLMNDEAPVESVMFLLARVSVSLLLPLTLLRLLLLGLRRRNAAASQ